MSMHLFIKQLQYFHGRARLEDNCLYPQVQEDETEGEAERSSKEEEFLAICQLHGVGASASLALQLKAVEAEYHSLKEAGQTHKADHVQQLYAWKSKKALQVGIVYAEIHVSIVLMQ